MLRIRSVEPLEGHCIRLTLSDGSVVGRDIDDLLRGPVFEPIRSDEVLIWGGPVPLDGHTPPPTLKVAIPG